jgi:hypothetical protein
MTLWTRLGCTLELVFFALFAADGQTMARDGGARPGVMSRCTPRQIRGVQRFFDAQGRLFLFFPGCLAIGAPFVLFRMKREGFSNCSVQGSKEGLFVRGRR